MKKFKPFIIAIVAIFAVVIFVWIIKGPLISSYLTSKLKTNVSIKSVNLGFSKMVLKNFTIKNLRGNKTKFAFRADIIEVDYSLSKLFSSPSIVDSILVDNIKLNIECKNPLCSKNNWTGIVNNISMKEKKATKEKEIRIKKITFKDLNVDIYNLGLDLTKKKTAYVKEIEFNNVNSKDGFPTKQLIAAIFKSANLRDYLKGVLDLKNWMDKFNPFSVNEELEFKDVLLNEKGA
ncbi:MAG: hypothetical protein K1060chlam5_00197 [Candidatus Anoxychlamydiales bacterium]|nr:hypothetical protein [Candidatus Anoxychlamydiales bacterium]